MKPCFVDLTPEQYHSDVTAISRSMLWRFGGKGARRRGYKAEYVDCDRPAKKPSDQMLMGTLAHAGMLHPESLDKLYAVYPEDVLGSRGRKGTTAAGEFEAEAAAQGRIVLKAQQMANVLAMVDSVNAKLKDWLRLKSIREKPIYWENQETGLLCRCMPDWLICTKGVAYCFDLKTTGSADPEDFVWKVQDYGYWLQQAHYSEGITAITGLPCQFRFVVVESEFPHVCSIQEIPELHRRDSEEGRLKILRDLKNCLVTNNWEEPWENKITPIVLRPGCFDLAS